MRILPVIFLFSMMTKAQDKVVLGFLIHGVNLILNKGMTGIWRARRYWLFFYIEEPIYPSVYHVFGGGKTISYNLLFSLLVRQHSQIHSLALYSLIACSYSFSMYSLSIWVIFFSFLALFSTILEFLFDDKFDTGYFSSRLNWLKFNVYISQFINF